MEKTILVVDDDEMMRTVLSKLLTTAGYLVFAAADGAEALQLVRDHSIKVAFLDLNLPDMNGIALCREIRQANPVICCFAVTGHRSLFELAECREAGFEDYFVKPVRSHFLKSAAQYAFERVERWNSL